MKITYLAHSAFLIELEHHLLLFDWTNTPICELPVEKPLYVFVSHHHQDHYHPAIFHLGSIHPKVSYIISDDIRLASRSDTIMCKPDHHYQVDDIHIQTLKSTDEGVAFIIQCENKWIYHAGDLNWWDWGEEDSELEAKMMKEAYQKEMSKITDMCFDIAFLPVDPRLCDSYAKGCITFMKYADAKVIVPMHMWNHYDVIDALCEETECQSYKNRIIHIKKNMETFTM